MRPIRRKQFPENLRRLVKEEDYPGLDVFICTADPFREPPINVVNTALSLMAYDYPTDKISVYVSDDGGSALTLFAFMEAAKFASYWLPFCRENNLMERSPKEYFASNYNSCSPTKIEKIKTMYENMKVKVENAVERGEISEEYITNDEERKAFSKWTDGFTSIDHPAVIQVILDKSKDKDITGNLMPSLIYVSRQKSKTSPHHFKAGALNVLDINSIVRDGGACFAILKGLHF
ncbi:Cellulose synthase [Corchorus olitorius]|uniref:Cellulose synthase n=1 Tax=Corchorus olitorius TaxID=93759 RepID=A0A1R3K720_9ROSI|nr:Cellulose synthase [Corchorus olitorius]